MNGFFTMAASSPIFSVKLTRDDVPGAKLKSPDVNQLSVMELKRWLECRGLTTTGQKEDLVKRCITCIEAGKENDILVTVDGGKWFEQKVKALLKQTTDKAERVPLLPVTGWNNFPSGKIPSDFCYGDIYQHIISTARLHNPENGQVIEEESTDFNTSKPMKKGRQFFLSGHVKNIKDARKGSFYFLKATVMASFTVNKVYNASVTLANCGKVMDASCECKASAMGRCNHVAALLFAIEDYTIQFGYDKPACTSQLCTWNVGRKRKNPQPAHALQYNKKAAPDRIINHDPRPETGKSKEADDQFINLFISTLPNIGNVSMFSQLLEIEYEDYNVDTAHLRKQVDAALDLSHENTCVSKQGPQEVPGTRDQADSQEWFRARNLKVTASIAKDAATVHTDRGMYNLLKRHLWGIDRKEFATMKYGKDHEDDAFNGYTPRDGNSVIKTGFWTNTKYPEIGCSPDGLIINTSDGKLSGVLEIKCPSSLRDVSPLELEKITSHKNPCYTVINGTTRLKRTHHYYYQIQTQIAVCEVEFCDFVIWTPKGTTVERILKDEEFWKELYPKLHDFYKNVLFPEYLEMRVPRRLMPVRLP